MRKRDVPQQNARAFMGHSKLLYAENSRGRYVPQASNGWEAEEIVLDQAIEEFRRLAVDAWQRGQAGETSPLTYHMYQQRMDVALLAQSAGFSRWRVRRHLGPGVFTRLSSKYLARYAEALGKTPAQLRALPGEP